MRKLLILHAVLFITLSAYSQVDVGITGLKITEPRTYNDGDVLQQGDTIERIQYSIHNYGNDPVENSDFGQQGVPIKIKYNSDSSLYYAMLVVPIQPGESKQESMPEFSGGTHFFPVFPDPLTGDLVVCVETAYEDDVDHSNDADCITLHHHTTSAGEVKKENADIKIRAAGRNLHISGMQSNEFVQVRIYNLAGRLMSEMNGSVEKVERINLSESLSSGIYLVQLKNKNGVCKSEKVFLN